MRALVLAAMMLAAAVPVWAADRPGLVQEYTAIESDTLPDIAMRNDLGYVELRAANPEVDPWLPGAGTRIVLPSLHILPAAPMRGIVINLAEQRLYFFPPDQPVQTYPIGVPAVGTDLRTGTTQIIAKRPNPTWYPPPSVRAEDPELPLSIAPGPDNPLGEFALYTGWTDIVIHGTNHPYGIGRRVSHGCFRLYPEDIERLYKQVAVGTTVTVVDQPAKLAWIDGELYLEVHPSLAQADEIEVSGHFTQDLIAGLDRLILDAATPYPERIDWHIVDQVARERSGIATPIFKRGLAASLAGPG